jgi:hypothetical protein
MRGTELKHGLIVGVEILASLWLLSLIWGLVGKTQLAITQAADERRQYEELEARKSALTASIAAYKTPEGQDAAIRTAFGVARPGEEVIVVVPPATVTPTSTPSFWEKVRSWF